MKNLFSKALKKNLQTFDPVIPLLKTYFKEIFIGIWKDLFSRMLSAFHHQLDTHWLNYGRLIFTEHFAAIKNDAKEYLIRENVHSI